MGTVISFAVWQLVQLAALLVLGFAAWKLYCRFDERRENRRRKAGKLAHRCAARGAMRFADLFSAYNVGDYSGIIKWVNKTSDAIEDGIDVISMEFEAIAKSVMKEKVATPEGRAELEALLGGTDKPATTTAAVS